MNPAIPLDEECGRPGRTQKRTVRVDYTLVSLPDKNALLLLLRLKRIHEERQKLPERHMVKHAHRLTPQ
jgi:hypothetical protein